LHLEFKFYIGRGWCVVLIWHDTTCKNWLVVKQKLSSRRSCFTQTLLISSHAHTCHLTFLRNWNQHQIEPTWQHNTNIYMTQEAIQTRGISWNLKYHSILPQKHYSERTISKSPQNRLQLHILPIGGDIALYVKFGHILISFAWVFNSRFNFAAKNTIFSEL
jgi:Cft2 family RNA processing exonuclease